MLSFFIEKLPPCLSKHLLDKLFSKALDLQFCEIPSLFLKGFWLQVEAWGVQGLVTEHAERDPAACCALCHFFSSAPFMVPGRKRALSF